MEKMVECRSLDPQMKTINRDTCPVYVSTSQGKNRIVFTRKESVEDVNAEPK